MQVGLFHFDPQDRCRQLCPNTEAFQKLRVIANFGTTVDTQNFFNAGDKENQSNGRVDQNIAEAIEPVVPRAIRQEERFFIKNMDKSRCLAPWGRITKTVFSIARKDQERRKFNEAAAMPIKAVKFLF